MIEICDFNGSILVPKDIWRLYVAVDYFLLSVQVDEPGADLHHDALDLGRKQVLLRLVIWSQRHQIMPGFLHLKVHLDIFLIAVKGAQVVQMVIIVYILCSLNIRVI